MNFITIKAYGKVNLSIDVINKRHDGYHNLKSVMQSISIYDNVTLKLNDGGIILDTNLSYLPKDSKNIAFKAAQLFYNEINKTPEISIEIDKGIPVGGGLGGGSADAAAVLYGLNILYDNPLSINKLLELGLLCGADVPFCLTGGTCLAEGLGEILTILPPIPNCFMLLVKPSFSLSTKKVFENLDLNKITEHPDTLGLINALHENKLYDICIRMFNVLEKAVDKDMISTYKNIMCENGALGSIMSGSGSTVFGVFETKEKAQIAEKYFKNLAVTTYIATPVSKVF